MKTRFAVFPSVLACAALALTACQQATPTAPEPSPIASAAPAPTVTYHDLMMEQLPSIARTETIQGGIALAAAFIEQHPRLFQEGGSELFAYLSMEECEYCASEQARALQMIDELGYQVGGEFRPYVSDAQILMDLEQFGETTLIVNFDVYEAPYTFVNAAGEVTKSGGDKRFEAGFALQVRDGIWRVRYFTTRSIEVTPWEDLPPEVREAFEAIDASEQG
jgi:hypothetical protein